MKELPFAGMLRRVAVFAAAGALLVSCTKEYDGFPSAGNELRFSVSQQGEADAERAMTRATPVTENKFHDAFGVFGYSHLGEENWTDVAPKFMFNIEASTEDGTNYTTKDTYFVPGKGQNVTFLAYAPYGAEGLTLPERGTIGAPNYEYEVPQDVAQQSDLCFAVPATLKGGTEDGTVNLAFHHALTAVSFVGSKGMAYAKFSRIALKGLYGKAVYQSDGTGTVQWTDYSEPNSTYSLSLDPNVTISANGKEDKPITTEAQTFMLLPQDLANAELEVTFKDQQFEWHTLTASLSDREAWQPDEHVTYTIKIVEDRLIIESVDVTAWNKHKEVDEEGEPAYLPERLKIGDYFYSDGTYSDGGLRWIKEDGEYVIASPKPTPVASKTVVGIVYATFRDHPDRFGKAERDTLLRQYGREPRGLVVAVKNASSVKWYNDDESPESGLPKTNRPSLCYKDISGLANSRHIEDTHGFSDYPAFKEATEHQYGALTKDAKTTGWYLPAAGQLWDVFQNLGNIKSLADESLQTSEQFVGNDAISISVEEKARLNSWLSGIEDADIFNPENDDKAIWTSSESNAGYAISWDLENKNSTKILYFHQKGLSAQYVRPVLAF